eukprot:gene12889-14215_t
MSDSFFGFDTSLPGLKCEETGIEEELDQKKYEVTNNMNTKNDETFNIDISAIRLSAIEQQSDSLLENSKGNKVTGVSVKELLQEEFDPSDGLISVEEELEEEEIIENSISQLGLDDEPDENNVKLKPNVDDDVAWGLAAKPIPLDDSAIFMQDLLSPDKRGIWASPQSSDKSMSNSPQHPSNNGQPGILRDIFGGPNGSRSEASSDVRDDVTAAPIKAIRAEDLERELTSSGRTNRDDDRTPVIIERRLPKMPAPPPGFALPMGTPPPGVPWMTPPGMMPVPRMMLSGQMQRMLAASPHMALFNARGMAPGMQNSPRQRGRHWSPQPQQQQQYNRRDMAGGGYRSNYNNNSNQQNRYWNKRDDGRYNNGNQYEDELIKLPPSYLMTSREKEWLTKIQLMTLISGDMYSTDFYYNNFMSKKAALESEKVEKDEKTKENEAESFNKLLDIVEQKKEERKYRPAMFEGSLGKLSVATVHHPRKIMDISAKDQEEEEAKTKAPEGGKKRFIIYGLIEKAYLILLTIANIDRRLDETSDEKREDLQNEKMVKINELFNSLKLSLNNWQKDKVNELFLQIMCIAKGKKLVLRALPYFNQEQSECAYLSVLSSIPLLIKKDVNDKVLPQFLLLLANVIRRCSAMFLSQIPVAISCNNISHLLSSSLGLNLLIILWEHILMLNTVTKDEEMKKMLRTWDPLKKDIATAISQLSTKILERNPTEIDKLKKLLQKLDTSFEN